MEHRELHEPHVCCQRCCGTSPRPTDFEDDVGVAPTGPVVGAAAGETAVPLRDVLAEAGRRALGGGLPGAAAMGIQVTSLMWLRSTVNYQYRTGLSTGEAFRTLYAEGGVRRFYRGIGPAMLQGPLSRFGDTAANAGVLALLDGHDSTRQLPVALKTLAASVTAAAWRILLMPIDTLKTTLQAHGAKGMPLLRAKLAAGGPGVMYHGALAASTATLAGHLPWFTTFNVLNERLPHAPPDSVPLKFGRTALMGFCSSVVSDTVSNSIRVTKIMRQTAAEPLSYPDAVRQVVATDGVAGLLGRGLKTKLLSNGVSGVVFAVMWKTIEAKFFPRDEAAAPRR